MKINRNKINEIVKYVINEVIGATPTSTVDAILNQATRSTHGLQRGAEDVLKTISGQMPFASAEEEPQEVPLIDLTKSEEPPQEVLDYAIELVGGLKGIQDMSTGPELSADVKDQLIAYIMDRDATRSHEKALRDMEAAGEQRFIEREAEEEEQRQHRDALEYHRQNFTPADLEENKKPEPLKEEGLGGTPVNCEEIIAAQEAEWAEAEKMSQHYPDKKSQIHAASSKLYDKHPECWEKKKPTVQSSADFGGLGESKEKPLKEWYDDSLYTKLINKYTRRK